MATMSATAKPPHVNFFRSIWRVSLGRYDVLLASLAINVFTLALPLVILQVYDRVIPNAAVDTFAILIFGLASVVVLEAALRGARSHITNWSSARFEHATHRRAVGRLLRTRIDAFEKSPAGTHLDRLAAVESVRDFHSGQGLIAISDLPFVALFLGLIVILGGPIVFAPLAIVAVAAVFSIIIGWRLEKAVRLRTSLDDHRYNFLFQMLNAVHTVKGLGLEAQMQRHYETLLAPLAHSVREVAFLSTLAQSIGATFSNLAMISVAAAGSILVVDQQMSGGALIASTLLAGRAVQPLIRMIGVWVQSRNLKLAEERLDALMTMPEEAGRELAGHAPNLVESIVLDDLTVHRGRPDSPMLSNVNLYIGVGEVVAVTGSMGGGKSALLEALAGLIQPDGGRILYDGVAHDELDPAALRQKIGYARQEPVLFSGTVRDNLTLFDEQQSLPVALSVASKLGLDSVIARLPQGMNTQIGDTAAESLAGSVQQVIGLVRVLARAPRLLLLDEANSAMDMDADMKLRELLKVLSGTMTIVMITSRPSMIAIADKVVRIDNGLFTVVRDDGAPPPMVPIEDHSEKDEPVQVAP